jgi:thioesterase domain-containing protein
MKDGNASELTEKPLVFLLPGLIDNDPEFDRVWDPLRDRFEILGVSYLDWTELIKPGADIMSLVLHIKKQVEDRAPTGPLRLAGYSIGGRLAYAVAQEFQLEGRPVARLVILDAAVDLEKSSLPLSKRVRDRIRQLFRFNPRGALASVCAKIATRASFRPSLRKLSRFRRTRLPFHFDHYLHQKITMQVELQMFRSGWRAMGPGETRLSTCTVIFRSADYDHYTNPDLGWGAYCSNFTVTRVAGDHGTMLHEENNGPLLASIASMMTLEESCPSK